ncbi:hypothetical protein D6D19_09720 [Aureobasidium pullulans]|uniref:AB hydrolase-1 domain-containing protein n=1 Tax=Aureobasidium pullulans TaxID=5580 RepID=A0A4V4INR6_AURPU|nr:hypothetical protein D6D19_09720 [Aureobasidium pullulans]
MDYDRPLQAGNMIEIGIAMHRPSEPKGVIFYNPGGTDAGIVLAWQIALDQTKIAEGLLDHDLLFMDVRGTYSSNPLNVSLDLFQTLFGPYPTTPNEYRVFQEASATVVQSWIDLSSPPGIIAHVSTREVVNDYEMVRKALGYAKINFLGASYGSYRAQQYAFNFPDQVGHFVLDAVTPHALSLSESALDSIAASNRALERADAYCQSDVKCPFHTQERGSLIKAFHTLVRIAENVSSLESVGVRQTVSAALLQGPNGLPDFLAISLGLHDALSGNFSFFQSSTSLTVADVVAMPLECSDQSESGLTFESFKISLAEGLRHDTSGIGMAFAWQIQLWCSAWPYSFSEKTPLLVQKSMLLVTSDFDDGSPTEWTTFGWRQAPNSGLVVRHGDGHVSFNLADAPSNSLTKSFLRTGILPSTSDDISVTVYPPGGVREPISDPYQVPFRV